MVVHSPQRLYGAEMDSAALSAAQLERMLYAIAPARNYLAKLCDRIGAVSFPDDDHLKLAARRACDGVESLYLQLAELERKANLPKWAGGQVGWWSLELRPGIVARAVAPRGHETEGFFTPQSASLRWRRLYFSGLSDCANFFFHSEAWAGRSVASYSCTRR